MRKNAVATVCIWVSMPIILAAIILEAVSLIARGLVSKIVEPILEWVFVMQEKYGE